MSVQLAGSFTRARARKVQAVLLAYFAYCLVSAVVVWAAVGGGLATPLWVVLTVAPVAVFGARHSIGGFLHPLLAEYSGRDDLVRELGPLAHRSYLIGHDVDLGRGTAGHLVAGPSGVYAIERSAWPGRFAIKGAKLTRSGMSATRLVDRASAAADLVSRRLGMAGIDAPVVPVLALTRSQHTVGTIALRHVNVVRADDLAAWIARRPVRLETLTLDRIRDALL